MIADRKSASRCCNTSRMYQDRRSREVSVSSFAGDDDAVLTIFDFGTSIILAPFAVVNGNDDDDEGETIPEDFNDVIVKEEFCWKRT